MRFTSEKKRQAPNVIIVSLIDILIVLLIFLMVTTTFKQQPALKLALPKATQAKPGASANRLVVTIDQHGLIYLGSLPITPEKLVAEFIQKAKKNPRLSVAIATDTNTPMGRFVTVMDALRTAHIQNLQILTRKGKSP